MFIRNLLLVSALCASSVALADNEANTRQQFFEMDKTAAVSGFSDAHKQACLKAFDARYQSQYRLAGGLSFNERLSELAYDRLFWKGEGNWHRGLLFTGAVTDESGAKAGDLLCYYALTDHRLDFQSAYVMPLDVKLSSRE